MPSLNCRSHRSSESFYDVDVDHLLYRVRNYSQDPEVSLICMGHTDLPLVVV